MKRAIIQNLLSRQMWRRRILLRINLIILIHVVCLPLSANTYSQINKITLKLDKVSIKTVLDEVKSQTKFDFIYDNTDINSLGLVSVNMSNASVHDILNTCFHNSKLDYRIVNNTIVITQRNQLTQTVRQLVKGRVVDESGNPLPGVSVVFKGTTLGVSTDIEGRFSISLLDEKEPVLVFSFIGMESKEVTYKGNTELTVILKAKKEELDEVIVTGMQTIKRERMTGSATVITAKDLENDRVISIDQAIEGKIAGLNSMVTTGAPGARAKITIRGENNLTGNSEPLWILDGLPMFGGVPELGKNHGLDLVGSVMQDGVGNVNPDDIESITILKDASATAMYGARAANGVIVITTKKGYQGETYFSYNGNFSISEAPRMTLDMMNAKEKVAYESNIISLYEKPEVTGRVGRLWTDYNKGLLDREQYNADLERLRNTNTDWFGEIFRPAISHVHSLSARGGNEKLTFYSSISYESKEGILEQNKYRNVGMNFKMDYRPVKKINVSLNLNTSLRKNTEHASAIDPFKYAVYANKYERPYDANGNYATDETYLSGNLSNTSASGYRYDGFNILRELRENINTLSGSDITGTIRLDYMPLEGLRLTGNFRYAESYNVGSISHNPGTYTSFVNASFANIEYKNPLDMPLEYNSGQLNENAGRSYNWVSRVEGEYARVFAEKHFVSLFVANEVMERKYNNFNYTAPAYEPDYRIIGFPEFPQSSKKLSDYAQALSNLFVTKDGQDKSVSFISTLTYAFNDKYVGNFTIRADGADIIGTDQRYTPLWSAGLRWNIHKEKFMQGVKFINLLALKGSYGYTGQIDRSAYPFSTLTMSTAKYDGNLMAKNFTYANPTVKWEQKLDRNFGIEVSAFDNRVSLNYDVYFNKVVDVLGNYRLPISSGRSDIMANTSSIRNNGWEATLNIRWINNPVFKFHTGFNMAYNKNKILKALNDVSDLRKVDFDAGGEKNLVGQSTGSVYGWKFAGVYEKSGRAMFYLSDEAKAEYAKLLDKWQGFNNRQQEALMSSGAMPDIHNVPDAIAIEENVFQMNSLGDAAKLMRRLSMTRLGSVNPKFVGGFNTFMKYKNIELSSSWSFKTGFIVASFDDTKHAPGTDGSDMGSSRTNRSRRAIYQWQAPGDVTNVPKFEELGYYFEYNKLTTSDKYEKGDFLRLQEITCSYNFSPDRLKRIGLSRLRASIQARNLVTFTKYRGLDPATGGTFNYPQPRQYVFTLTVGI